MRNVLAALAMVAATAPAAADDLAARFAARPAARSVALSPLGDKIAYIGAYKAGGNAAYIVDLTTGESKAMLAGSTLELRPYYCGFKTETRLICLVYGVSNFGSENGGYTRIIAVDADGKNVKMLSTRTGVYTEASFAGGSIINWLPDDPDHVLMEVEFGYTDQTHSLIKGPEEGTGAAVVDIRTGTQRIVEPSRKNSTELDADAQGNVRFRGSTRTDADGIVRDSVTYAVRAKGSKDWQPLASGAISDARRTSFEGFDADGDHIYEVAPLDGRKALYSVATDGSATRTLVYARDDVDIDGVLRIGKFRRPVGVEYTTERNFVHYFDPELGRLSASLSKAMKGRDVSILDESWDGGKKLVYVDGDNVPGQYYLYDAKTRQVGALVGVYPGLDGVALGAVKAVSYTARDGTKIPAFLTLPPGKSDARGLPGLVMPHGGPSARDSAGFDWLAQFFAAEGFAVLQPNFRGSAGYGDAFFAKNGFKSWPLAIGDVNDGGRWLLTQGVESKRLAIFGWSYGGYAALQANVVDSGLYRATVAVAPVTDLGLFKTEAQRRQNTYIYANLVGDGPHVLAGSPARHASAFVSPVLMFHGDRDLNVEIEQSRTMAGALRGAGKQVELVEFHNLSHQLDDSEARTTMLAKSAAFLKAAVN